eukprot:3272934-Karenia_brevis.AAC.1
MPSYTFLSWNVGGITMDLAAHIVEVVDSMCDFDFICFQELSNKKNLRERGFDSHAMYLSRVLGGRKRIAIVINKRLVKDVCSIVRHDYCVGVRIGKTAVLSIHLPSQASAEDFQAAIDDCDHAIRELKHGVDDCACVFGGDLNVRIQYSCAGLI